MTSVLPSGLVLLLAAIGVGGVIVRLGRTLLRLGLSSAEAAAASGLADVSARRGDLTGLAERRDAERAARGARRRDTAWAVLWLLVLILPPLLGWTPEAFAVAALVWLLPRRPLRRPIRG